MTAAGGSPRRRGRGEDSIYRDGNRWRGAASLGYGPDGRPVRKKVSGATRDEVVRKLRRLHEQLDASLPPSDDRLSVGAFLDRWWSVNLPGQVAPSTLDDYGDMIRLHLRPALGRRKLTKLTVSDCDLLWQAKREAGYSPHTIRMMRAVLRKALGQALREGLVPRNVASLSAGPGGVTAEGRTLTPEQAQALLGTVRGHRWDALVTIMLAYGLRRGEALGLHWDRLDWTAGTLAVSQSVKRIRDYGTGWSMLVVSELKTARSRRVLCLTPELLDVLHHHRTRQGEERLAAAEAWQDHGLIFPSEVGTPIEPNNFTNRLWALCRRAGLGHWHPHELRHSGASLTLAQGTELHVVSEVLGHTSIAITKDVYGHLLEGQPRAAAEAMSRALFGRQADPPGRGAEGRASAAPEPE
ncbi:tyrosine recombinase XerC [Krasilnikovia sp. M28-CT-15]|uniref:site-specific integrase n=1 Tax=Krasilnikovia sp. M28-CT-15 TaxID=3373540 RepID=UPI0038775B35